MSTRKRKPKMVQYMDVGKMTISEAMEVLSNLVKQQKQDEHERAMNVLRSYNDRHGGQQDSILTRNYSDRDVHTHPPRFGGTREWI